MTDLDDKLRKIYDRCDVSNNQVTDALGPDEAIAQIKQAFAEAGYLYMGPLATAGDVINLRNDKMSGQEWYDRFKREWDNKIPDVTIKFKNMDEVAKFFLEVAGQAAKRASGVKE